METQPIFSHLQLFLLHNYHNKSPMKNSRHLQLSWMQLTISISRGKFKLVKYNFRYFKELSTQVSLLKTKLEFYWNKTVGLVNETLSDYPLLAYGSSVMKRLFRVGKALVEQYSVESNLRLLVQKVLGQMDSVASTLVRIIDVAYNKKDLMSYEFDYDLASGHVEYLQVLPFQWYSFSDSPDIVKVAELIGLSKAESLAVEQFDLKEFQHDLLEVIGTVSQAIRTKSVIPPFSATALLAGDSHIMTFDRRFYDFAGSRGCSYLLASDFSQGRFSAIANYDDEMSRTSIEILTDGHTINIDTKVEHSAEDGLVKITLDNRNVQLPILFDHTYVHREENSVIVENSEGFRVTCNTVYNVCTFTISGWFFGKTGGLLGVYDNEPSNDWMNPERELTHSLEDFVDSWVMDKHMLCPVKFAEISVTPTSHEVDLCDGMFVDDNSALMPCFSTIDPEPFHTMCLKDMELVKNQADQRSGVCPSSAAYIEQCRRAGVELWMPAQCVHCADTTAVPMRNGESTRYQGNSPRSSDIVFIVEQKSCLVNHSLVDLPYLMDRALASKSFQNNRFALVGFGGAKQLERPHIYTSGNQVFADMTRVTSAFSK
jgi:hypothetical protein